MTENTRHCMYSQRICTHILFLHNAQINAAKTKRECNQTHHDTATMDGQHHEKDRRAAGNRVGGPAAK